MLVLTRKIGEEICIDGNVRVTLIGINGKQAHLGVTAPRSVRVVRAELLPEGFKEAAATTMGWPALQATAEQTAGR
jgi:carbon storage regulator